MPKKYYVYVLFRPDGSPLYVGKGTGRRCFDHDQRNKYNRHLKGVVEKARRDGCEIPVVKIRENLSEPEAFQIEIALIAAIGRGENGPLVNLTDGGDGIRNLAPEIRAKMSKIAKARPASHYDGVRAAARLMKGRPKSEETRRRISAGKKGKKFSPEHCASMSRVRKGRPLSREQREALRRSLRAAWAEGRHPRSPLYRGGENSI